MATVVAGSFTPQRKEALERANSIRIPRARLKHELKAGHGSAADVLMDPPEFIDTMKVFDLLRSMPGLGKVKANDYLRAHGISQGRPVGELSLRQRLVLADSLQRRSRRRCH